MLSSQSLKSTTQATAGVIGLYFLPTILMVLCYVLIYHQCEDLMVKSRIASAENYHLVGALQSAKLAKCLRIFYYSMISCFIFLQILLMVFCLFDFINP